MSIDTLAYVKTLESAGVERKVAEAHVKAMNDHILPELATRSDLEQMEQRLEHSFQALEGKFGGLEQTTRADFARLEQKFDNTIQRIEATIWKAAFAVLGGGLAIGGFLIRFLR
jgi:hypothetical protein